MAFDLGSFFGVEDEEQNGNVGITEIPVDKLVPYHSHPFELYSGERLEDMVESVKKNGVLCAIVVQPLPDGNYEILIGHNRWNASKIAGLETVPAIIKEGLTAEEAETYVVESNVMQRGFDNLKISEQAAVVYKRKSQLADEKRIKVQAELIELEGMSSLVIKPEQKVEALALGREQVYALKKYNANTIGDVLDRHEELNKITPNTIAAFDEIMRSRKLLAKRIGSRTRDDVGNEYGVSGKSVARLIRIHTLSDEYKSYIDSGKLSVRAGVQISYLNSRSKEFLGTYLKEVDGKISEQQAKELREAENSADGKLTGDVIMSILGLAQPDADSEDVEVEAAETIAVAAPQLKKPVQRKVAVSQLTYDKLIACGDDIEQIVESALNMYFNSLYGSEEE